MADLYDLTLLLDPGATDDQRAKIIADAESAITSDGTLVGKHDWGRRPMAYEVEHKADAEYTLFQFHATPTLLERLQRSLKIADGVIRFRIIKLAPGTPDPPQLRAEPRPETVAAPEPIGATEAAAPEAVAEPAGDAGT
ncbi:MAG: 30S ribosomal protein S6 [Actinomycetota bacterium]|nr:30S ribosomal protein S6 [Actinomycetota bacterium]